MKRGLQERKKNNRGLQNSEKNKKRRLKKRTNNRFSFSHQHKLNTSHTIRKIFSKGLCG